MSYRRTILRHILAGFSIDELSRDCGVSKTTIYRHWPSRAALLIDACSRLGSAPEAPDTGTLRGDVQLLLTQLAEQLQDANWSSVYPAIIDAAERDPEIAVLQARLHETFMAPFEAVVERGKSRGELPPRRAVSDVVAALVGPLFYCRWFSKQKMSKRFVTAIIDFAIR